MLPRSGFRILPADQTSIDDEALSSLLFEVYAEAGFTEPEVARVVLSGANVRARGTLLAAVSSTDGALQGCVVMVAPTDRGRVLSQPHEAEMHVLAVCNAERGRGIGAALVEACMAAARERRLSHMVLWTQPTMHGAHRLYERCGFVRNKARDMERGGRPFLVYERAL